MRTDRTSPVQPQAPATRDPAPPASAAPAEGRARLSPERIAAIRTRIASGACDHPEVIRSVASRILQSGDLDAPAFPSTESMT